MTNSSDIAIIVRCAEVCVGLHRVDRRIDYNDLLRLLSEMTGFDLNLYSLKVSTNYAYNDTSQIFPITCNRDLHFFFDLNTGFRTVELFVEAEMMRSLQSPHDQMENPYHPYMSYIAGESEMPQFINTHSSGHDATYVLPPESDDDVSRPCDSLGNHDATEAESEPEQNNDDEQIDSYEDQVHAMTGHKPQATTQHPSFSNVPFFDSTFDNVYIDSFNDQSCGDFTYDDEQGVLKKGMMFADKKQLQTAVKNYSIKHARREYGVKESSPTIWKIVCKQNMGRIESGSLEQQCNWFLRAICSKRSGRWKITQLGPHHTCLINPINTRHTNLCKNQIAEMLETMVRVKPAFTPDVVQVMVKERFDYDISYHMAWHALTRALENVYGTWESSCQYLPKFMTALQRYNPGSVVEWRHLESEPTSGFYTLMYVFWAFKPCIDAFQHCRKVISVDGTHLYTKYKQKLLIDVTIDANQMVLPIAYAIVDEESFRSWHWFLYMLATHVVRGAEGVCLISDRHKGILKAVEYIPDFQEPKGVHRFCLRHVASNFNAKFKNVELKDLCYSSGSTLIIRRFERIMQQINELNSHAFEYLSEIDPCKWTCFYDEGRRFSVMTTNMSECINSVLKGARRLPITANVRLTFARSKKYFVEGEKASLRLQQINQKWPPKVLTEYEKQHRLALRHSVDVHHYSSQTASVSTFNDRSTRSYTYQVILSERSCSCGRWSNNGMPCSHALAVCRQFGIDPTGYVHPCYSTQAYVLTYSGIFQPLADDQECDEPSFMLKHNLERRIKRRGRNVISRIPNEMDWAQTRLRQQYQAQNAAETSNQGSSSHHR